MKLSKNLIIWGSVSIIIVVLVVGSLYFLDGKYDYNGDILALGQLLFDIILLPVVFIGFVLTLNQLKVHFSKPDLVFGFLIDGETKSEFVIELPETEFSYFDKELPPLAIKNIGEAIPTNYMIRFTIPKKTYFTISGFIRYIDPNSHIDNSDYWRKYGEIDKIIYEFRNNSDFPLFPKYPVSLGFIMFRFLDQVIEQKGKMFEIDYLIYCDNFEPKVGKLKIIIK